MWKFGVLVGGFYLALGGWMFWEARRTPPAAMATLTNAANDSTRELFRDLNERFVEQQRLLGRTVEVVQSHGSSGGQARAVADGMPADVATLGFWGDMQLLAEKGLVAADWETRLPHQAAPCVSTVVFVVRRGNPKSIRDWPDLARPGVKVIFPNPKTSGNGKLAFLAAWMDARRRGGEEGARDYAAKLVGNVPVFDTGARGSASTFAQKGIGDVHLAWESEAHLEVATADGTLELAYPPASLRAQPPVAVVEAVAKRRGSRPLAEAYLKWLYSSDAQEIFGRHYFRPTDPAIAARLADRFPPVELRDIGELAADWGEAQRLFFADGGRFDEAMARIRR